MSETTDRICAFCKNVYSLIYTNKGGYKYTLNTDCCSRSCAGKLAKSISKETLAKEATSFIREKNQYCTRKEVIKGIKRSAKTFTEHEVKISEINEQLGFVQPLNNFHKGTSKFQKNVGDVLNKHFSEVKEEVSFKGMVGRTGFPLRVDFYIPEANLVIEADGDQHHNPNNPWHQFKNGIVPEYDKIKEEFLKEKNIRLIRIPYKQHLKESDVLSKIVSDVC